MKYTETPHRDRLRIHWLLLPLLLFSLMAAVAASRDDHRDQRISFSQSAGALQQGTATVSASISGHESVTYLLEARTGQSLDIRLASNNIHSNLRITAPAAPRALHDGAGSNPQYSGVLPRDGIYRIRVFLNPAAADNKEMADFSLNIRLKNPG